jgi:hypothetical protein
MMTASLSHHVERAPPASEAAVSLDGEAPDPRGRCRSLTA